MNHYITIQTKQAKLSAVLHYPANLYAEAMETQAKAPIIVICHGFIGNKIGTDRLFVEAARELSEAGNYVLRFDYAGCGESEGDYGSGGLDALVDQTRHVLDYVSYMDHVDLSNVILLGHSLGGAVALLTAVRDTRVKKLILWAPVAQPLQDIVAIIGDKAYQEGTQSEQATTDHFHYELTKGFLASLSKYQPLKELIRFQGDVFIAHGTNDDIIPVDYSFLYQKLFWTRHKGTCDKEVLLGGDHSFSSAILRKQLFEHTKKWLHHHNQRNRDWSNWTI